MDDPALLDALSRAERALERIERAASAARGSNARDAALRDKVHGVVAELDQMIRDAGAR
ncbi:MAG: hypothetical protein ABIQ98_00310 [Sphingomicrobium sp.]